MTVTLDVDVMNVTTESEAREAAFKLASILTVTKGGRPASGPRAVVTGIVVRPSDLGYVIRGDKVVSAPVDGENSHDALEEK